MQLTSELCEFAIVGREKGENGTPHLQGFVNWKTKVRMATMLARFPRAHLEFATGTDVQNQTYCSKENDIYLAIGEPSVQGKRNDLLAAVATLHEVNGDFKEVARAHPCTYIRNGRGLRMVGATPRTFKTIVLIGSSGCGKSRAAAKMDDDYA